MPKIQSFFLNWAYTEEREQFGQNVLQLLALDSAFIQGLVDRRCLWFAAAYWLLLWNKNLF